MTHWSTRSLALAAMQRGLVVKITHSTVALILRRATLQPHRSRYWKTVKIDERFRARAAPVLWCYEKAAELADRGEVVLCLDEKPAIQVLARDQATRPMAPGQIEHREFEYHRHGTVNLLVVLVVHTGRMLAWCIERNDAPHLKVILKQLLKTFEKRKRVHLIWDGGASHTAGETTALLKENQRVRVLRTPPHASWLNQAELLLRAFSERYLVRGEWSSQQELKEHLRASWPEYNRCFAHPFVWSWTRRKMHAWVDRHMERTT